ncbi:hypothetical protein HN827_02695 [archaeon]|jgi:hypothetical protein|nr:hypothetical protein [archaeon]
MGRKESDLPKSIVVILIVLAVFISVFGTWTIIKEMNSKNLSGTNIESSKENGKVSISILDYKEKTSQATGKVSLELIGGPKNE